jgi:hypothetical protein
VAVAEVEDEGRRRRGGGSSKVIKINESAYIGD